MNTQTCNETKPKQNLTKTIKANIENLIPHLSFLPAIITLYILDPNSFQITWKGRAPQIIFLWLLTLELAITWKNLQKAPQNKKWTEKIPLTIAATLPTAYVLTANLTPIKEKIINLGAALGTGQYGQWFLEWSWPLSLEYIFLTISLTLILALAYKTRMLKLYPISTFFLAATATFYTIDTFYPYAFLGALQSLVPMTTLTTAQLLNLIGYKTVILQNHIYISALKTYQPMPILNVSSSNSQFQAAIFWPSSGIHSLFIYTFIILLFQKHITSPLNKKVIYTIIGAIGTFFANILRITTICIIGLNNGQGSAELFHTYIGELYFITWILTFMIAITYSPKISTKTLPWKRQKLNSK